MMKQAKQNQDGVFRKVGQVYVAPSPNDPNVPSGNVSLETSKYTDRKAAGAKAKGLQ
jgi:hypothetical protein